MRIWIMGWALALGACASVEPAPPPAAVPTVTARIAPGAPLASGEARLDVAAAVEGVVARPVPADCRASGAGFEATFAAPATLAVPTFGDRSGPVRIACAAGDRSGAVVAQPARRALGGGAWPSVAVGIGSGGGYVSLGGFWGGGWTAEGAADVVDYPDVEIAMR